MDAKLLLFCGLGPLAGALVTWPVLRHFRASEAREQPVEVGAILKELG